MSDLAWNIWGAIAAVAGTLLAVVPLISVWLHARLPSTKLPGLISLLEETKEVFATALREGLITDEKEIIQINFSVTNASIHVDDYREIVYSAPSYPQNVRNWWNGISNEIASLHKALNVVRVQLVKRSSLERKLRMSKDFDADFSSRSFNLELPSSFLQQYPSGAHRAQSLLVQPAGCSTLRAAAFVPHDPRLVPLVGCQAGAPAEPQHGVKSSLNHCDAHRALSDSDIHSLLSLAASHHLLEKEERKRQRAIRNEVLLYLGRQLQNSGHHVVGGDFLLPKRRTKRSRFKTLARLLRRTYGVRHTGAVGGLDEGYHDPESLLSHDTKHGDGEGSDDEWDDE